MIVTPVQADLGGTTVRGTLHEPAARVGPVDLVVLEHGFGSNRIEGLRLFVTLARHLCDLGFAVAAFDRPGHGESDGDLVDVTVDSEVAHVVALLAWLTAQPRVDAAAVHLLGMSMGAVLAAAAAPRSVPPPTSLTLWSPAAVFADELRGGSMQGRPFDDLPVRGYVDFLGQRVSPAYVAAATRFDPYAAARGYHGPVRVLHGADDTIVPTSYARRYADLYGTRAELTVVPAADHGWSSVPLRGLLYDETSRFLLAHATHLAH